MDVSRRDFMRLGTSAAVTTTAVAQAGGGQVAAILPPSRATGWRSVSWWPRYVTLEPGDRRGVSDRFS